MKTLDILTATENQSQGFIEENTPIKLNRNESPFDVPESLKQSITNKMVALSWNRYPDFHQTDLTQLLADSVSLKTENILLGNGSSQLIQQIFNCFSKFISEAIIENPTFTLYHQICQNERLSFKEWHLNEDGTFNIESFPAINEPSIVIITSPNNPTGTIFPKNELSKLLKLHPECIFLVDEAYGEFATESSIDLISEFSNLLVLKTFSKGFGLPSVRFGYVAGSKVLIDLLRKHTIPFTINIFSEMIVREALTNHEFQKIIRENQERIKTLRDSTQKLLSGMAKENHFAVIPSQSNFILVKFQDTELFNEMKQMLVSRNILVNYPVANCIRITIGTEAEMNTFLQLFEKLNKSFIQKTKLFRVAEFEY